MRRTVIKASSNVSLDLRDILYKITDKYNAASQPISGDWRTETESEMNDIADALNISTDSAKALMIHELGFSLDDFDFDFDFD